MYELITDTDSALLLYHQDDIKRRTIDVGSIERPADGLIQQIDVNLELKSRWNPVETHGITATRPSSSLLTTATGTAVQVEVEPMKFIARPDKLFLREPCLS